METGAALVTIDSAPAKTIRVPLQSGAAERARRNSDRIQPRRAGTLLAPFV